MCLVDPDGFAVEVIAGATQSQAQGVETTAFNWNGAVSRSSVARRIAPGPSTVARLGHADFVVSDVAQTWQWCQQRFGLLMSDEVRAPDGGLAAIFVRCNRGSTPADHHTLNFAGIPGASAGFHHAAFEVGDVDDLMRGNAHLQSKGYRHAWGVGRHVLGSQNL